MREQATRDLEMVAGVEIHSHAHDGERGRAKIEGAKKEELQ